MTAAIAKFDAALRAMSRQDVVAALGYPRGLLTVAEVQRLSQHLESLQEPLTPLKVAVVRTCTTELLRPCWKLESLLEGFRLDLYEAPFGALLTEAAEGSGLRTHRPDVTYVFLQWEDLEPRLNGPWSALSNTVRCEVIDGAVRFLRLFLGELRRAVEGHLVLCILPRFAGPGLGQYDAMAEWGEAQLQHEIKQRIAKYLRDELPSTSFFDVDLLLDDYGRSGLLDQRLWHTSRAPFSAAGAQAVVRSLIRYPVALLRPRAKCIVLDADNTLWGGIVGEDGPTNIALGPDYPGSVYVAFQRRLLGFQQRGLLLALCSRNNPADVSAVLKDHPHQLLRENQFAAMRVNWQSKVANLREIAEELNLGLDSFIYVDDSPHECRHVCRELPEIDVVQVPDRAIDIPVCLDGLSRLEILSLTREDQQRSALYAQQRCRRKRASESTNGEDYLASLEMAMTISVNDPRHVRRIAQLTQKTNQFNLTTRRYSEAEVQGFLDAADCLVACFSLADVFGDSGVVGVAIVRDLATDVAEFDTFLMSCRVIGRQAETAFLQSLLDLIRDRGVAAVRGRYRPTEKNVIVSEFWSRNQFQAQDDNVYILDLSHWGPGQSARPPIRVELLGRAHLFEHRVGDAALSERSISQPSEV